MSLRITALLGVAVPLVLSSPDAHAGPEHLKKLRALIATPSAPVTKEDLAFLADGVTNEELAQVSATDRQAWALRMKNETFGYGCYQFMETRRTPAFVLGEGLTNAVARLQIGCPFSHLSVIDNGNTPGELRTKVLGWLDQLMSKPTGAALVKALIAGVNGSSEEKRHVVFIQAFEDTDWDVKLDERGLPRQPAKATSPSNTWGLASPKSYPSTGKARPEDYATADVGFGVSSTIQVWKALDDNKVTVFDTNLNDIAAPAFTLLGHELIHSYHFALGNHAHHFAGSHVNWTSLEEERTIGSDLYVDATYNENKIRDEHKLPKRKFHVTEKKDLQK